MNQLKHHHANEGFPQNLTSVVWKLQEFRPQLMPGTMQYQLKYQNSAIRTGH